MKSFVTRRKTGAAERNWTSDPVITNECQQLKTRRDPTLKKAKIYILMPKLRKSAQEIIRNLRCLSALFFLLFLSSCAWGTNCIMANPSDNCAVIDMPEVGIL